MDGAWEDSTEVTALIGKFFPFLGPERATKGALALLFIIIPAIT